MVNRGFSLLELSIVLVIIGLIAGGIVAGSSMIRAAELRSIVTDSHRVKTAMNTFRDKYLALPGDMKNAVRFWGAQAGGTADGVDATCAALDDTSPSTDGSTCNGNGDGEIGSSLVPHERFKFWQHLANAGLIDGSYTGVQGAGGVNHIVPFENALGSKMSGVSWTVLHWNLTGGSVNFDNNYGSHLLLGATTSSGGPSAAFTVPEEAWNLDKKIDDGMPATGNIIASRYEECTTATAGQSNNLAAEYLLSSDDVACAMRFKLGF